jgi:hypothetical protein
MKLGKIDFIKWRQFIDEALELDPSVTVIVGRNDSGKTAVLNHFFDQCVYENVISWGDRPRVPDYEGDKTRFSLTWKISAGHDDEIPSGGLAGSGDHVLEMSFRDDDQPGRFWTYSVDGREIEVYKGTSPEGHAIMNDLWRPRHILPTPRYVSVAGSLMQYFEMRPYDQPAGVVELPNRQQLKIEHRLLSFEARFLRLAGIRAQTRGPGHMNETWPMRWQSASLSLDELHAQLESLAARIDEKLAAWWVDPPGLKLKIRLTEGVPGTYGVSWTLQDAAGLIYYGAGLQWFLTFVIEWLSIEDFPGPLLLLFDEPGAPLHPSAQRAVAKILGSVSRRHQLIYSTHSPFMIDWNFPQRIRLFHRDYESKRTHIRNKPYASLEATGRIWDPLRESVGVTIGDIAVLGSRNVLVEGVSDQILLANVSAALEGKESTHLGLPATAIIPYGDKPSLDHMIAVAKRRDLRLVVMTDGDRAGKLIQRACDKEGIPWVSIDEFSENRAGEGDRSIEDILGVDFYIGIVNDWYGAFEWYRRIDSREVQRHLADRSLGFYLNRLFQERFERRFDKVSVMISVVEKLYDMPEAVFMRLKLLVERIDALLHASRGVYGGISPDQSA